MLGDVGAIGIEFLLDFILARGTRRMIKPSEVIPDCATRYEHGQAEQYCCERTHRLLHFMIRLTNTLTLADRSPG